MASGSFELNVRDRNSGKDLDALGLSFCARYNRGGDSRNSGAGSKIHVFAKRTVGELRTHFGKHLEDVGHFGDMLGHLERSWGHLGTSWDILKHLETF